MTVSHSAISNQSSIVKNNMQIELGKFVGIQYHLTGFEAPENPETEPEIEEIEKTSPERPFTFIFCVGQLLQDFEKNIAGKEVGYKFDFYLSPAQAYGEVDPEKVIALPKKFFCDEKGKFLSQFVMEGGEVPLQNQNGDIIQATVEKITDTEVICDVNHPLAGMTLHFVGEVVEVRDTTEEDKKRYMQQMTDTLNATAVEAAEAEAAAVTAAHAVRAAAEAVTDFITNKENKL